MIDLKEQYIQGSIYYPDLNSRDQLKMSALMRNFQQVGGIHLETAGTPPEELLRRNLAFMLIRQEIVVESSISAGSYRFGTWVFGTSGANFIRNYEMLDQQGRRLAVGAASWIVFDMEQRKVLRPDRFESKIPFYTDKQTGIDDPGKFKLPEDLEPVGTIQLRYTDMDSNQHVNNAVYGDIAAHTAHLVGIDVPIVRQKLYFRHEVTADETIQLLAKREEGKLYLCGDAISDGRRSFEAELTFESN